MRGMDYLGLGHRLWPVTDSIRLTPPGMAIGCFDTIFGDVLPNIRRFLKTGKYPAVRVHLDYNKGHTLVPETVIRDRAPKWERLAKAFPETKIYISHSCEHNDQDLAQVKGRMALLRRFAPSCTPVNCVWQGAVLRGEINESHSVPKNAGLKGSYICSNDGTDFTDFDSVTYLKCNRNALILYYWGAAFNFRDGDKPAPAPKERTFVPTKEYIRRLIEIANCKV